MNYYSNGKLLITGEYLVLDGAKSFALPTIYGQDLTIQKTKKEENNTKKDSVLWQSVDRKYNIWFECELFLPNFDLKKVKNNTKNDQKTAKTLQLILRKTQELNPLFLNKNNNYNIKTKLDFDKNWGLGTSSTLINNIANWANVNAFALQFSTFGGSAYDIACAQNNNPIFYTLLDEKPIIERVIFNPTFTDELFFVYLNTKKNSRIAIENYRKIKNKKTAISKISAISNEIIHQKTSQDFAKLLKEHEQIISKTIKIKTIQEQFFSNYSGQIKSLGAWEGDFILAIGDQNTPKYFKNKGFETVIPYKKMIL